MFNLIFFINMDIKDIASPPPHPKLFWFLYNRFWYAVFKIFHN